MTLNDRLPSRQQPTFIHHPLKSLLTCIFIFVGAATFGQGITTNYIRKYKPLADILSGKYHIPASIILGIAIVETGSGTSAVCKRLNNHFGIRGGRARARKGHRARVGYRQYPSVRASYIDFCEMVKKKKYYAHLKSVKQYKPWLQAMSRAGYSTRPAEWMRRVTLVISKNKL